MAALPRALLDETIDTLDADGHTDLANRLRRAREARADLTSKQAAALLGVSSPNTVKNWLEGGCFPDAWRTAGGHWRFPRATVLALRERMEALRARNAAGDLTPPEVDEDFEP